VKQYVIGRDFMTEAGECQEAGFMEKGNIAY
jgi:hypothetical protein